MLEVPDPLKAKTKSLNSQTNTAQPDSFSLTHSFIYQRVIDLLLFEATQGDNSPYPLGLQCLDQRDEETINYTTEVHARGWTWRNPISLWGERITGSFTWQGWGCSHQIYRSPLLRIQQLG